MTKAKAPVTETKTPEMPVSSAVDCRNNMARAFDSLVTGLEIKATNPPTMFRILGVLV